MKQLNPGVATDDSGNDNDDSGDDNDNDDKVNNSNGNGVSKGNSFDS